MGCNELALSWKDHHGVLFNVFEKLLAKKSLVDCTLAAEGKFLKAHRIVLSACSPYFEILLNQEYDKHPIIFLRDVHFEDLKTLIEFVYSGEIKIPEDRLVEFLSLAESLQIKGLGGVGSEGQGKEDLEELSRQRQRSSPIPRKRTRRHSNNSEDNSRDSSDSAPASVEETPVVLERQKSAEEKARPVSSTPNVPSVPSTSNSTRKPTPPVEELRIDISKVKKEVPSSPVANRPSCSEQLPTENVSDKSGEEILGLKPEFTQVTFPEDNSDDWLPEDSDSVEPMLDQDQPSSSHQYSGFVGEPVDPGELPVPLFPVSNVEQQPPPEGSHEYVPSWHWPTVEVAITEPPASPPLPGSVKRKSGAGRGWKYESYSQESPPKKFQCPLCPKSFHENYLLGRHSLTHSGAKPHACPHCPLRFALPGNLLTHMRTHSGAKPFACPVCEKTFRQKAHMTYHVEHVHGLPPPK